MPETPAELHDALISLGLTLLGEGPSLTTDLERVLSMAQRSVPGCDAGSVTLIVEGRPQTEAAIDRVVVAVDLAQYEMHEGPYLQAATANPAIRVDVIATDDRFPRSAERAAHTGVQSSLSLPIVVDAVEVGSLDLYSWTPFAFGDSSQDLGAVLATQVGAAVAKSHLLASSQMVAVSAQRLADENADIAVAQGVVMVLETVHPGPGRRANPQLRLFRNRHPGRRRPTDHRRGHIPGPQTLGLTRRSDRDSREPTVIGTAPLAS